MTDNRQPKDPEGGALLWSVDGVVTIRATAGSYHVFAEEHTMGGRDPQRFNVQRDDLETFVDQLRRMLAGA